MPGTAQARVLAATLRGVEAVSVDVEVSVGAGMPGFSIVGMADASVQESRERVRSAIRSCGFTMPSNKIVVNLAPGALRKTGSGFDLPIAVGILCATGQVNPVVGTSALFVGELSLEGAVRPVAGLLAYALLARERGVDLACAEQADVVPIDGLCRRCVRTLASLRTTPLSEARFVPSNDMPDMPDFRDIAGHDMAKRALQIAAAGGHGILMMGPPGSGKTMLASRLPSILPPLSRTEALETAVVWSVAGEDPSRALAGIRPFRNPHHSASLAGLVGGGNPVRPGEISLAHHGVLMLDEIAEFSPSVLQGIRQPLESGRVVITRVDGTVELPARFMLVASSNPCPCGYYGDDEHACTCTDHQVRSYQTRIGGPIMDRIDVHVDVRRIHPSEVLATGTGTSSEELRAGVLAAREYAAWRRETQVDERSRTPEVLVEACALSSGDREFLEAMADSGHLSGRAIVRTLALARTIADMEQVPCVSRDHLCEAIGFRVRGARP